MSTSPHIPDNIGHLKTSRYILLSVKVLKTHTGVEIGKQSWHAFSSTVVGDLPPCMPWPEFIDDVEAKAH